MRNTWILIGILGFLVLVFLTIAIFPSNKKAAQPSVNEVPTPTSVIAPITIEQSSPTPVVTPSGDTITISNIPVQNFYLNTTPFNPQGDRVIANVDNAYKISYLSQYQQFLITITGSPFETFRQQAEAALLQKLNLSQADACKLNVVIRTPSFANPNEAGQDYPLSFCQ